MLVLTRKESERIKIGDNIVLVILRISGGGVRIGIEAPQDVRVMRTELLDDEPPMVKASAA